MLPVARTIKADHSPRSLTLFLPSSNPPSITQALPPKQSLLADNSPITLPREKRPSHLSKNTFLYLPLGNHVHPQQCHKSRYLLRFRQHSKGSRCECSTAYTPRRPQGWHRTSHKRETAKMANKPLCGGPIGHPRPPQGGIPPEPYTRAALPRVGAFPLSYQTRVFSRTRHPHDGYHALRRRASGSCLQ
ncbi:hypothetical protein B9Z19DRAFT_1159005 [Tuber borchii]|uniref:Uncharacterized protein n=1 Tax=Tuber borchii TaxID=42251 RepID=A0A2T6ZFT6_TUBBO|nr:hypothetical protein B9Z19DRAFT_1159005 [Tuber borchii]